MINQYSVCSVIVSYVSLSCSVFVPVVKLAHLGNHCCTLPLPAKPFLFQGGGDFSTIFFLSWVYFTQCGASQVNFVDTGCRDLLLFVAE